MQLCYYSRTLKTVKKRLLEKYPEAAPSEGATDDVGHTLWMIEQVSTLKDQGHIDRFVGWIGAKAHSLGLLDPGKKTLSESKRLIASDLGQGHAK